MTMRRKVMESSDREFSGQGFYLSLGAIFKKVLL